MNHNTLTMEQSELLSNINGYIQIHGYPPTVRELCKMSDIRSTSTMSNRMNQLRALAISRAHEA